MVSAESDTKILSAKEAAIALENQGIQVATYYDCREVPTRCVVFHGCEEYGHEVIKVAKRIGLTPHHLRRIWNYLPLDEGFPEPADGIPQSEDGRPLPYWELTFLTKPLPAAIRVESVEELQELLSRQHNATGTLDSRPSEPVHSNTHL